MLEVRLLGKFDVKSEQMPIDMYLLQNILIGTIPAAVAGFVTSIVERMSGPRAG